MNIVVIAGMNDEVLDFCSFARQTGRIVRFIEYMPLDGERNWRRDQVVPSDDLIARIHAHWPLEPVEDPDDVFRFKDGRGEIRVVASVTRPLYGTCNRLRLAADGAVRKCLFARDEASLRDLLRAGASDDVLALAIRRAVWGKRPGHDIDDVSFPRPTRSMSMIGG